MAHNDHLKAKARELRAKGMMLAEIMERLSLPKTTTYGWIADMPRPERKPRTLAQLNGAKAVAARYARLRDAAYQQGMEEAHTLFQNASFRDFVTIFLCEGY